MSFDGVVTDADSQFLLPVADLLKVALARLQRQAQYQRVLAKGGRRSDALRHWMDQATGCITALARPEALFMPVTTRLVPDGVRVADRVTLDGADIAQDVRQGAQVTAYLLTLNYAQPQAFEWLGHEYGAHHVQSDLGSEVLFALGREAHRVLRMRSPAGRLRRVPVLASAQCGQRQAWDPARVQALLTVFDVVNPGVQVTDTGCFTPLNSLLGLALHAPAR
ncbi:hypothetical protein [Ruegeria lacuscaerulensis]|uniref:hypothetical protein n=1 Tax=Ruegeria lacuscaerulensis TaxID=55218 RepID=UPI00147CF173|nr:hypothetical protein [Ruegeria lacuscaerulensis]